MGIKILKAESAERELRGKRFSFPKLPIKDGMSGGCQCEGAAFEDPFERSQGMISLQEHSQDQKGQGDDKIFEEIFHEDNFSGWARRYELITSAARWAPKGVRCTSS